MNIDVELQDPYMFSKWPIFLILGLFILSLIVVVKAVFSSISETSNIFDIVSLNVV